jgi:hypothetical protein
MEVPASCGYNGSTEIAKLCPLGSKSRRDGRGAAGLLPAIRTRLVIPYHGAAARNQVSPATYGTRLDRGVLRIVAQIPLEHPA